MYNRLSLEWKYLYFWVSLLPNNPSEQGVVDEEVRLLHAELVQLADDVTGERERRAFG